MLMTQKEQMLGNSYCPAFSLPIYKENLAYYHIKILVILLWVQHTLILKKT